MEVHDNAAGPLLAAGDVHKHFGALVVLDGVDITLARGEGIGIVGPNGAGKTTLLDVLSGAQSATKGRVLFEGQDISGTGAAQRCRLGIGRSHQVPRPFEGMTVFENVLVGATAGGKHRGSKAQELSIEVLGLTGLLPIANRNAETLGLLERKRLELARALATEPRVLLLDEIAGGLTDEETVELVSTVKELQQRGIAIIWIEHIVHVLVQVAQRLICMAQGKIIADGAPDAVMRDPRVVEAYLGSAPA